ncbi:hypothetical protein EFT54_16215 [Lacticaseibacillus paracasei]|nr:hypothetical protein [Lacticaseibacillus paracasei]
MLCKNHFSKKGQVFFHIFWVVTLIIQSRETMIQTVTELVNNKFRKCLRWQTPLQTVSDPLSR